MDRTTLVNDIITTLGAITPDQILKINLDLSDIILLLELRNGYEILIEELIPSNIYDVKREVMRRYRYG